MCSCPKAASSASTLSLALRGRSTTGPTVASKTARSVPGPSVLWSMRPSRTTPTRPPGKEPRRPAACLAHRCARAPPHLDATRSPGGARVHRPAVQRRGRRRPDVRARAAGRGGRRPARDGASRPGSRRWSLPRPSRDRGAMRGIGRLRRPRRRRFRSASTSRARSSPPSAAAHTIPSHLAPPSVDLVAAEGWAADGRRGARDAGARAARRPRRGADARRPGRDRGRGPLVRHRGPGRGGRRRRRDLRDAPLQRHGAAPPPRARPGRRGAHRRAGAGRARSPTGSTSHPVVVSARGGALGDRLSLVTDAVAALGAGLGTGRLGSLGVEVAAADRGPPRRRHAGGQHAGARPGGPQPGGVRRGSTSRPRSRPRPPPRPRCSAWPTAASWRRARSPTSCC